MGWKIALCFLLAAGCNYQTENARAALGADFECAGAVDFAVCRGHGRTYLCFSPRQTQTPAACIQAVDLTAERSPQEGPR